MKPCPEWKDVLRHRAANLTHPHQDGADAHLAVCPGCREYLAALQALCAGQEKFGREMPSAPVSHDLAGAIERRINARPDGRRREPSVSGWRIGLAAAVSLAVAVVLFAPHRRAEPVGNEMRPHVTAEGGGSRRSIEPSLAALRAQLARNGDLELRAGNAFAAVSDRTYRAGDRQVE